MNIVTARNACRASAKDAEDSGLYSSEDVDRAIQYAGNEFCRLTRCLRTAATVALTASSPTFDITLLTDLAPDQIIDCFLLDEDAPALSLVDYADLSLARARDDGEAKPRVLAFLTAAAAEVWPTPDDDYTAKLRYWQPFTSWTPGTQGAWSGSTAYVFGDVVSLALNLYRCTSGHTNHTPPDTTYWQALGAGTAQTPSSTTLNLPNEFMAHVTLGAAAVLKFPSREAAFASNAWQLFQNEILKAKGAGNMGQRVIHREPRDPTRPQRKERTPTF